MTSSLPDAREAMINAAMDSLASFGNTIPPAQRIGSLPISFTLRMLPTFILALLKSVSCQMIFGGKYLQLYAKDLINNL